MKILSHITLTIIAAALASLTFCLWLLISYLPSEIEQALLAAQTSNSLVTPLRVAEITDHVRMQGVVLAMIVILLTLAFAHFFIRKFGRAQQDLLLGVQQWEKGDLSKRLPELFFVEQDMVAKSLNALVEGIERSQIKLQKENHVGAAIFSSMVEGVIATDMSERIIAINPAARELLQLEKNTGQGQLIQEVIRNRELQLLIENMKKSGGSGCQTLGLRLSGDRHIEVRGSLLQLPCSPEKTGNSWPGSAINQADFGTPEHLGVLLILNDTTQLRKLEKVRRDFVANVSHELRTPITSIKGFIETLLDGAQKDPAVTTRFLEIVRRHTDRLSAIIDDLLALTKVEDEAERNSIVKQQTQISEMIQSVLELATPKAEQKHLALHVECTTELSAKINRNLVEQALTNLVENAVKYSDEGGTINIRAASNQNSLQVTVEDNGIGISKEHLPRLFERFYRVDRARTREQGGTGLGLSIVKHIATVHGGEISAESELGKGSRFTLSLPLTSPH